MKHLISDEDRVFQTKVETCKLPVSDFDHAAHVRLAYVYLLEHSIENSMRLMRDTLLQFLNHHGVDPSKYHETMTQAWILAVRHFIEKTVAADSADSFICQNPELLDSKIMMSHYSAEVLFSEQARKRFTEPDLVAIPRYGACKPK